MPSFNEIKEDLLSRMSKTIDSLKGEFAGLRAGRAHASLLDGIMVDAYGSQSPLSQVATVNVPDARTLAVSVWDRALSSAVEKAIREANLGLNPISDGQVLRLPIPPLTEERRAELSKVASKYSEQAKIAIRNIRRDVLDVIKDMKKNNEISEDEERRYETEVQKHVDEHVKKVDTELDLKEKDIMQV